MVGIRGALLVSGAVLPVLAALLWSRLRTLDGSNLIGDELVDLFRSVPIFGPLELPMLERLARSSVAVTATPGEDVITEGGHGDRYYVIGEGKVEVSSGGKLLRTLGPGDAFGEIALLRDVPRTATVTALRVTTLHALEREHFLEAVNGSQLSREAAESVVDVRLGSLRAGLATV